MTFATDLLVAGVGVLCARSLWRGNSTLRMSARSYWAVALVSLAIAAASGGTAHAFAPYSPTWLDIGLWRIVFFFMGLASFAMMVGTAYATLRNPLRVVILALACGHFVAYAAWMARHSDFRFVIGGYGSALVVVGLLAAAALVRGQQRSSMRWWLTAIAITAIASMIQRSGYSLHRNFNHNDLYHVIGTLGVVAFYLGARTVSDVDSTQVDNSDSINESMGATDSENPPLLDVDRQSSAKSRRQIVRRWAN